MFDFYKKNSEIITKLILYQFGSAVLGIIVTTATHASDRLMLFAAIFSTAFYLMLLYMAMWEEGGHERIKVDGGRAEMKPLRGLYISLWANVPNLIFAFLIIIGYIFGRRASFGFYWAGSLYAIFSTAAKFWESMYLGFIVLYSPYNPIIYVLIVLPALAVSAFAYIMGLNNRKILNIKKK